MRSYNFSLILLIVCMLSITNVMAITIPANTNISFKIPTNLTSCNLTISKSDTTTLINQQIMGIGKGYANYTIGSGGLATGNYLYFSECGAGTFTVTKTGFLAGDGMEIFIWILFIICVVGNITMLILILVKLATSNETVFGVLAAWGFYTMLLVTDFLGGYLVTTYIEGITGVMINIFTWSNGVLPVISLVITMFIKGTQKKKPIGINEFTGQVPFRRFTQ